MTIEQIAAVIACVAAAVAVLGAVMSSRARRTVERTFPIRNGNGVITFPRRMSDDEVERFKAEWSRRDEAAPRDHCGELSPDTGLTVIRTECVLRPGHTGSHADDVGCRWSLLRPDAPPDHP